MSAPLEGIDATRLVVERSLEASAEEVFAAWTDPDEMAHWMAPGGVAEVDLDARVGGAFRVVMIGEGLRIEHTGEYLEVDPPRRLSFTWSSPYTGPDPSVVTVELVPEGSGVLLTLTHERLPGEAVESHRGGWGSILEQLADRLHTRAGT